MALSLSPTAVQRLQALQHCLDAVAAGEGDVREVLQVEQRLVQPARVWKLRDGDHGDPYRLRARVYL